MVCLIWFLSLIWLATCFSFGIRDSKLNPGRISWPKNSWISSPIQASQTNAGETVALTFSFTTSTALNNGVLEIYPPSNFLLGPCYISSSFEKNQDFTLALDNLILPSSAGLYGPFALITRSSSTGKIYDANYLFGFIKIENSISPSALVVASEATNPMIGSTDTLYFSFSLSQSLWKYDIFEIVPEPTYKISSVLTCTSATLTGITNMLYGPNGDSILPCALAAQSSSTTGPQSAPSTLNSIYIYGLTKDIYLPSDSVSVKFSVSTFTYPLFPQSSSSNVWMIKIWRWGTTTLLASYSATSGPLTPSQGSITASWVPISEIPAEEVVSGMSIFTKVTFMAQHEIPAGGIATLIFASVDIYTAKWWSDLDGSSSINSQCYITPPISGASCTVWGIEEVTIRFANNQVGPVSIALLCTFATGAKISQIVTSNGFWAIDSSYDLAPWSLSATNIPFSEFKFHGYGDATSVQYPASYSYLVGYLTGADTSIDLYWIFKHDVAWTTATTISINLPHSVSQVYNLPYISYDFGIYELDTDLSSSEYLAPATKSAIYRSSNTLSVAFNAAPVYPWYIIAAAGPITALPYVASNLGTFYECFAIAKTDNTKEIWSSVYSVLARDYSGTDIFVKPLCINNVGSGIPIVISFMAKYMTIDFTSSTNIFALEVQFQDGEDLGTGIAAGSILPIYASIMTATAVLVATTSSTIIKITGLGTLAVGYSAVDIFLSAGKYPRTYFDSTLAVYYTTSSDPDLKNYLYRSSTYTNLINTEIKLSAGFTTSTWSILSSNNLFIQSTTMGYSIAQGSYIGIGLPPGYTLSIASMSVGGAYAEFIYYASSANYYANGGFVMGTNKNSPNFTIETLGKDISVEGLTPPGYSGQSVASTNNLAITLFVATSTPGSVCQVADYTSIVGKVNAGSLSSSVACSSSSPIASGPDSVDSTLIIEVTTINKIPKGGTITLILNPAWTYYSSTCTASGLSDINSSQPVVCSISSSTLKITQFSDFPAGSITIIVSHVLPPSLADTYSCVSEVYTQDSVENCIDFAEGLSPSLTIVAAADLPGSTSSNI